MSALGLPISVHPTAPEGPNMSMPSVGAMGTEQCLSSWSENCWALGPSG